MTEKKQRSLQDNLLLYGLCTASSTTATAPSRCQTRQEPGSLFPRQLATALGMAKIAMAILLFIFGSIAIVVDASLALLGGGMWGGMVVLVTGIFAIIAAKRPSSSVHVMSFLCLSILSIAATGMVIVFSATGLVNDMSYPNSYYVDNEGNRLATFGEVNLRGPAIILNAILVVVGTLDCLLSVACCIVTAREACKCTSLYRDHTYENADSETRKERLISWLGQQALLESNTRSTDTRRSASRAVWHIGSNQNNDHVLLGRSQSSSSTGSMASRLASYELPSLDKKSSNQTKLDSVSVRDLR